MAFKPKTKISEQKGFEKGVRLVTDGDYEATVTNARFKPEDDKYADAYFIDFTVDAGPEFVGSKSAWAQFFKTKYKNVTTAKGGVFTAKQQEDADAEKVQVAFAAALGLSREEAGELGEGGSHDGEFAKCFEDGDDSSVVGRKVLVRVRTNKAGYADLTLFPVKADGAAAAAKAAAPAAPAKPKTPPAAPKTKPTFEAAYSAAGFVHRDDAPGWFWNESTEEQLDESDLRVKLGY